MATRFNDFNLNGEERLLLGKECVSSKPIALAYPVHDRKPLAMRQFEELQRAKQILEQENSVYESDEDFFDFDEFTETDFADNYSQFEALTARFEEFKSQQSEQALKNEKESSSEAVKASQEDVNGSETVLHPSSEE